MADRLGDKAKTASNANHNTRLILLPPSSFKNKPGVSDLTGSNEISSEHTCLKKQQPVEKSHIHHECNHIQCIFTDANAPSCKSDNSNQRNKTQINIPIDDESMICYPTTNRPSSAQLRIPQQSDIVYLNRSDVDKHLGHTKTFYNVNGPSSRYEQLINEQGAEIVNLKTKIEDITIRHQSEILQAERQLFVAENKFKDKLSSLEQEFTSKYGSYQKTIDELKNELAREKKLSEEFSNNCRTSIEAKDDEISVIRDQMQSLEVVINKLRNDDIVNKNDSNKTISSLNDELCKLKQYISCSQDDRKSSEMWKYELSKVKNSLDKKCSNNESLNEAVSLLNVRIESLEKILKVYENEFSQNDKAFHSSKYGNILSKWREKVYELMINLQTEEISRKKEQSNADVKIKDLLNHLKSSESKLTVAQNTTNDYKTQLEIENNKRKSYEEELHNIQEVANILDDKCRKEEAGFVNILDYLKYFQNDCNTIFKMFNKVCIQQDVFQKRISFASSRIEVLKAQLNRRQALLPIKNEVNIVSVTNDSLSEDRTVEDCNNLHSHCEFELGQLTKERDMLSKQMNEDALLIDSKINSIKEEYESEINALKTRIQELHEQLELKDKEIDCLSLKFTSKENHLEKIVVEAEFLREQVNKNSENLNKELQDQKIINETELRKQVDLFERDLNNSKRELAQSVVVQRQLKRKNERDKEKHETILKDLEGDYSIKMHDFNCKLMKSEREKNIYMTTLKQEGLFGKVKSNIDVTEKTSHKENIFLDSSNVKLTTSGHLNDVIDDLKMLTSVVLSDDDT